MRNSAPMSLPVLLAFGLMAFGPSRALAGPQKILVSPKTDVTAPLSEGRVDHALYGQLLERYSNRQGMVDYAAWKAQDAGTLERYLRQMAAVDPKALADDAERIAYWVNVYNALTIHGILFFYPTDSIKEHVSYLFGFNFWKDVRIEVGGAERSLHEIEHEILRPMGEPVVHFGLNCASLGCPRLYPEPYVGRRVFEQLADNGRYYLARPSSFRIEREEKIIYLPKIFDWFAEDFGATKTARLHFVARFVDVSEARWLREHPDAQVEYARYDWALNDQKNGKP